MDNQQFEHRSNTGENENITYASREEYVNSLKEWLDNARLWHGYCAGFPYYMNFHNTNSTFRLNADSTPLRRYTSLNGTPFPQGFPPDTFDYIIPPVWKRIFAEIVDFFILFIIKMALTFLLLEGFNLINIEFYGFESFQKNLQNPKILLLELIHRAVACAYEAYFLKGGMCATPGKRSMGIMVVCVANVIPSPESPAETVRLANCIPLGLKRSIIRSVLKNFIGLLLPFCFALYFLGYNRTGYDMVANSLVVESNANFIDFHNGL